MQNNSKLSELWEERINNWAASGMTQANFCEAQGISFSAFGYWRSQLNKLEGRPVNGNTGPKTL